QGQDAQRQLAEANYGVMRFKTCGRDRIIFDELDPGIGEAGPAGTAAPHRRPFPTPRPDRFVDHGSSFGFPTLRSLLREFAAHTTDARMKRIGASLFLILALAGPLPASAAAGPGAGGEHRLTAQEIRELARKQLLWCDTYHAKTDDCQMVTLVGLLPDGRV